MADPSASAPPPAAPYPPQQEAPPPAASYPPQEQQQQAPPPQQPYPPQQQGQGQPAQYPPQQQAAYPPQQQYPPAAYGAPPAAYPPQQQSPYPPQVQPGYPAGPYPQQGAAPPPYFPEQQQQQIEVTKVEVIQQQPTVYVQRQRVYGTGDHGLILAIIATVAVLFCCLYFGLICTLPAIFLSISAQDLSNRGDDNRSRNQTQLSYILSSVGLASIAVFWISIVISSLTRSSS